MSRPQRPRIVVVLCGHPQRLEGTAHDINRFVERFAGWEVSEHFAVVE